jgi:acyl carrier protein
MLNDDDHRWFDDIGLQLFSVRDGIAALDRLIASNVQQATVAHVDWRRFKPLYSAAAGAALLTDIDVSSVDPPPASTRGLVASGGRAAASDVHGESGEDSPDAYLQSRIAQALGVTASEVPVDESVNVLGLDSLMAIRLKEQIQTERGVSFSVTEFLKGQTIQQLAARLTLEMRETTGARAAISDVVGAAAATTVAPEVAELSDTDLDELLVRLLEQGGHQG